MVVLYDSLQLAHKCILNSFYGYVMRKAARWYSMEMAGVVTQTGAAVIRRAKDFVDRVGIPLELDTDGIWCALPKSFPENFEFHLSEGKKIGFSFICSVFNRDVSETFTNHQYQVLEDERARTYSTKSECSIFFEVDGPYRAMVLPASKEEGKSLKKRYAVFNHDGSIAEIKGFELKRRGELKLIKVFQKELFGCFLGGDSLLSCYKHVGSVANRWLDVLHTRGGMMEDDELIDLLMEQNNMSRSLAEYLEDKQKSCAITTASRIAELLGSQMVRDKGLACKYIIARQPEGTLVTERAIPIQVFESDELVRRSFLKRWLRESRDGNLELKELIDWDYYRERLGSAILKMICIPAALQKVPNPVPRIPLPDWLSRQVRLFNDPRKQASLDSFVKKIPVTDIENTARRPSTTGVVRSTKPLAPALDRGGTTQPVVSALKPDIRADFRGWVKYSKRRWLENIRSRRRKPVDTWSGKRRRYQHLLDDTIEKADEDRAASRRRVDQIGAFFSSHLPSDLRQAAQKSVSEGNSFLDASVTPSRSVSWQIISVEATDRPGEFRFWILPQSIEGKIGELAVIPLRVPRRLYLNSRAEIEGCELVNHVVLPRNHPRYNIYALTVSEFEFLRRSRELSKILGAPTVEGIYEGRVPLDFEVILSLGCVCGPKKRIISDRHLLRDGLTLSDLAPRTGEDRELGPAGYGAHSESLHQSFLYSVSAQDGSDRHVFAVLSAVMKKGTFVMVTPYIRASKFDVGALWTEILSQKPDLPKLQCFELDYVRTEAEAFRILGSALGSIRADRSSGKRTMVAVQSTHGLRYLQKSIPVLRAFPTVSFAATPTDGKFGPVGWERVAAHAVLWRFAEVGNLINHQLGLARSAGIPVGNINSHDSTIQALDILFGRALRARSHLLWACDGPRPDLGGAELEDNRLAEGVTSEAKPEVVRSGVYRTTCIELELEDVAIAAVLESEHIQPSDGSEIDVFTNIAGSELIADGSTEGHDELFGVAPAFRILKEQLSKWYTVVRSGRSQSTNPSSDTEFHGRLLDHLYRWVRSESSLFHDPALHRLVHGLISKVFWQLMAELSRLGTTIVHATPSRLLIATPRASVFEGLRYVSFVEVAIREKQLFNGIRFVPITSVYSTLAFLDPFNFAGVPSQQEEAITRGNIDPQMFASDPRHRRTYGFSIDVPQVRSSWDICRYLPKQVARMWEHFVAVFVRRPLVLRLRSTESLLDEAASQQLSKTHIRGDFLRDEVCVVLSELVTPLFDKVMSIRASSESLKFPRIPGTSRTLRDAALEFSVALCHVFELDKAIEEQAVNLRRDLLNLLNVREFSVEASFSYPCVPILLSDIMCDFCNAVVDLDLSRSVEDSSDSDASTSPWTCEYCAHPYDTNSIELALVRQVQMLLAQMQLQDLKCKKCGLVKRENLSRFCDCASNAFEVTVNVEEAKGKLDAYRGLSELHNLRLLSCISNWTSENF